MAGEDELREKLQDLQKQLGKKQLFEGAVSHIKSLLTQRYLSSPPSLRKLFFTVVSRVATVLKTRYTAPGFWTAGLGLFLEAESLATEPSEKLHLQKCISHAREQLSEVENQPEAPESRSGYLFEGHLTVDPEPPQPAWLAQSNLLTTFATLAEAESSQRQTGDGNMSESASALMQELMDSFNTVVPMFLEDLNPAAPRVPPASKEVVAKLPVITITEELLAKLGPEADCCICKENLIVGDKMQELPCKHKFHPLCLKPWLDEHNSCPICRQELQTDDHNYESWKEREKEAEEERKGAANAVREGEYMYV